MVASSGEDHLPGPSELSGAQPASGSGKDTASIGGDAQKRSGIVYISRVPPTMQPHEVRSLLAPFGHIERIYLAPDARSAQRNTAQMLSGEGRHGRIRFSEGWVEFARRTAAKKAVLALNGMPIAASKKSRLYGEIWSMRLLPASYSWQQLNAQHVYDSAVRAKRLRNAITQGRRSTALYIAQSERSLAAKATPSYVSTQEQMSVLAKKFKQRKPIIKE